MTQSPAPSPSKPRTPSLQHLWLNLKPLTESAEMEVTELIVLNGVGRSFQYCLPANVDRETTLTVALIQALKRCTVNTTVNLHTPHTEYVRLADRRSKRPPQLTQLLNSRNLELSLARRINGVALFAEYAEALNAHTVPPLPPMIDYRLHTSCLTDGLQTYVGAVLVGVNRIHTWRNTVKGDSLLHSELQAARWAFSALPDGSSIELHNQSPKTQQLWQEPETIPDSLKPYMLRVAQLIQGKQLRFHTPKQVMTTGLYRRHACLLAGTQFADVARERP
ncbi:hypothetical protein GO986_12365 [Deinococcus sp. HMF7620]|uniref:Uncharacterized protein n=1 Tax=Deinococcus arboris TaxID=2682977 RepID=A0A7C9LUW5_9DEIO|nr:MULTISPECIES: hypothetical protein [Deinococcus]MBZ9752185.1 hypothetical protein [Deinococcus betulae]MVN87560.1 hypothetical protein [Deinococcus arboris]